MELWNYYRILRKRRWLIIIGTLICVFVVGIVVYLSPRKWIGYTTVTERSPGEEKVAIFTSPYAYQIDPRLRIANLTQLVKSRTVMERSAETLTRLGITRSPKQILLTLSVRPVMDSTLLSIEVRSGSRGEAEDTAGIIALEFKSFYDELSYGGAARSKEFIERELPKAEKKLKEVQERMRKYEEESGAVMLPHQADMLIQELSQFQRSLAQYQVEAQQAGARLESMEEELKAYPETRTASTVVSSNPVWQSLQVELSKQEIELQKMLENRTAEHPDVKTLKSQIAETKKKLEETGETVLNSTTEAANPIRDALVENYITSLVNFSSANAACSAAQQVIDSLKPELKLLPEKEMRLAQLTLDEGAARNTYSLLRQKLDEATIRQQEAENVSSIEIVDQAESRPTDTNKFLKLILAMIVSPMFCSGMAFLLNYLDNTIRTPAEVEELLKLPVYAAVPAARVHSLITGNAIPAMGESYQMLSTNLLIGNANMCGKTILVASAEPDVGRSAIAANLAITLARDGARVILVDSDLRQPALHAIFGMDNERGFSNILAGQIEIKDAIKSTSVEDLQLIPSGPLPANPVRLLRTPKMVEFVRKINDLADFVIFDSPAGIAFADGCMLAAEVKNVLIVYAAGTVPRGTEAEFHARLNRVEANILGVILNMVKPEDSHGYYHFRSAYEGLMRSDKGSTDINVKLPRAFISGMDKEAEKSNNTDG